MKVTSEEQDLLDIALEYFGFSTCAAAHGRAVELLRQLVKDECSEFQPDWASAPGETLADIAKERGHTPLHLARQLGISVESVNYLLAGRLTIDEDLAEKLSQFSGSKQFWLERERTYRRNLARLNENFQLGVAALLWRDGKVLMQKRQGSHGAGTWSFPGGHIDSRETPSFAICREVREETGLAIPVQTFRPMAFTTDIFEVEGKRYITLYFEADCHIGNPQIMEPEKCSEQRWVQPGDWPGELFLPIQNFLAVRMRLGLGQLGSEG